MIEQNLDAAQKVLRRKLRDPASIPDGTLVIPLSLLAARNPLTSARWNVLHELRAHGRYERLQDLADALGRGKHRVSKDVDVLAGLGLVHKRKHGRETAVEPDARQIVVG